jgi:hypothetical protein
MSNAARQFVWVMRIYAFIYLVGAVIFLFRPDIVLYLINAVPKGFSSLKEIPLPSERFWSVLATSMMVMLCLLSIYASLYPKVRSYVFVHLAAKMTSVAGFSFMYIAEQPYFAYLFGAIVDGLVILTIGAFYLRSLASRETREGHAAG